MFQESGGVTTAPLVIDKELWVGYRTYLWFLLVSFVWVVQQIVRIWFRHLPFSASTKQCEDPEYLKTLRRFSTNISRWLALLVISWALLFSLALARTASELRPQTIIVPQILSVTSDLAVSLAATLFVILFMYVTRWHLLGRIERCDLGK